mmetsp:Transcript_28731/g.81008  ORF Transcript_28731/g.81008 Transcript_28731/m.81008 type:complete len:507 (+) Transcript_28731:4284-5804(+)
MRNGEFERHQVETIPNRGDEDDIGSSHECHPLLQSHFRFGAFLELHGSRPRFVDPACNVGHFLLRFHVVISTLVGGNAYLDQDDLSHPFGASFEKPLHAQHLQRNPLQGLQSIDCAEDGLAFKLAANGSSLVGRQLMRKDLVQHRRFNSRMNACDGNVSSVVLDGEGMPTRGVGDHSVVQPQQSSTACQKVTCVFKEVEADLVGVEHASQQILAAPHGPENLGRGEWRVQEDADLGHWNFPSEVGWKDQQVESVNPYQIAFVEALDDDLSELSIHCVVRRPHFCFVSAATMDRSLLDVVHGVFRKLSLHLIVVAIIIVGCLLSVSFHLGSVDRSDVVHDGPKNALAESVVHLTKQGWFDPYWHAVELSQAFLHKMAFVDRNPSFRTPLLAHVAVPSTPFDDTHASNSQMSLHAQQHFVIPIRSPLHDGGAGRVINGPVEDDGQECRHDDQAVSRIEMHRFRSLPERSDRIGRTSPWTARQHDSWRRWGIQPRRRGREADGLLLLGG